MKKLQFCLVLLSLLVLALGAVAQVQNGQFTGSVTDPSGAAITNAKVTVTNLATNFSVSATTNQSGLFAAKELPVGTYKITAEAAGFKTATSTNLTLNAGSTLHTDFKMQLGEAREIVEVSGQVAEVNTEDSKLASTVGATEVANLPLNGRNIYDLIQLSPGAVNVRGVVSENGANTVVNGLRENFNGFLINGSSNKGLSGGVITQPVEDTVQEFQELTLNMSAQYGNSAGSVTNLVTKSGTNSFHGSAWEFNRNDVFDANNFFLNQSNTPRQALRFNQFGGTFGGPIIKDKLFFFLSYQGDHFRESAPPTTVQAESKDWRDAVISALPNSTAALLYSNFAPTAGKISDAVFLGSDLTNYLCADTPNSTNNFVNGPLFASRMQAVLGVTPQDQANATAANCLTPLTLQPVVFDRTKALEINTIALNGSQNQTYTGEGNLFNGWETSARIDYNPTSKDRLLFQLNWNRLTDMFGFPNTVSNSNGRGPGFLNPALAKSPNGQISFIHTFSPSILNEFRAGYALNITGDVSTALPGVPDIRFDDGSMGFGSYSGYPQVFHENIYTYSDMVSISHGKHNMKVGVDFRRNIENSEFNVARPSYYFFDPVYFAADAPYTQSAGVDPGILSGQPGRLASNFRHWRNLEMGAYFQDDWKVSRNLTLNLGMRYDLFKRHNELNNLVTTFIKGPGNNFLDSLVTGNGQIQQASVPGGSSGTIGGTTYDCTSTASIGVAQLAPSAVPSGTSPCGPGGFATASSLGAGDHNNFGPRVGFAWDVFGDAKTSLRGGFGVSYEGTLYNPLSNSRWNLPYYSFNSATNFLSGDVNTVIYGPYTGPCTVGNTCTPDLVTPPTYLGGPTNPNQGTGAQAVGNLTGWDANNPNLAILTGIVFPTGIKDPYVYNYFLGIQREIMPKLVVEANYVGTTAHKLFRAENVNRQPGERLPQGLCATDNFGRRVCSRVDSTLDPAGRLNPNFGTLRVWENVVNSNYNALQLSLRKQASHGITFNVNYTWSHAIDGGSTWHSGSTSSNGAGGGEGYTTDATLPGLDRGNSIFDVRQRLVANYVWELPWYKNQEGVIGHILGGWQYNGIISWQSGAHWEPWTFTNGGDPSGTIVNGSGGACSQADIDAHNCFNTGGDFNLDGVRNDRPNVAANNFSPSHDQWANGWGSGFKFNGTGGASANGFFTSPCLACVGNEGRNTFVGPSFVSYEASLFKNIKITERFSAQFRAEAFNVLNHTNFQLPGAGGATNYRTNSSSFGQAGGVFNPRQLQLGLKVSF
ncbi:MAG: carboxypeptidase regulatory-like domain-containing protein [Acidobacteriia bacterium]|nr:carboxypeptidase regulatory-like domain-containing protein [Terriglobia bacterium]